MKSNIEILASILGIEPKSIGPLMRVSDALIAMEEYAVQFVQPKADQIEYNAEITLPPISDIREGGNKYYEVKTEHFGWQRAMHCQDGWYLSYISKLTVPVLRWRYEGS